MSAVDLVCVGLCFGFLCAVVSWLLGFLCL